MYFSLYVVALCTFTETILHLNKRGKDWSRLLLGFTGVKYSLARGIFRNLVSSISTQYTPANYAFHLS